MWMAFALPSTQASVVRVRDTFVVYASGGVKGSRETQKGRGMQGQGDAGEMICRGGSMQGDGRLPLLHG